MTFTDDLSDGTWHQLNWVRGQTSINIVQSEKSLPLATNFDPYSNSVSPEIKVYVGAEPFQTGENLMHRFRCLIVRHKLLVYSGADMLCIS